MAVCLIALPVSAFATAQTEYDAGIAILADTTTVNFAAAAKEFDDAIAADATFAPAYVLGAICKWFDVLDDPTIKSIRSTVSGGNDSISIAQYINRWAVEGDTSNNGDSLYERKYVWGSDPVASDILPAALRILNDTIPIIESYLSTAESLSVDFTVTQSLLRGWEAQSETQASPIQVDKADVMLMRSEILLVKAALVVATSYDLDLDIDPDEVDKDTKTFEQYRDAHPNFLAPRSNWDTAYSALTTAETTVIQALVLIQAEADPQDTNLWRRDSNPGSGTDTDRSINDTDVKEIYQISAETISVIKARGALVVKPENADKPLGSESVVIRNVFDTPINRETLNELDVLGPGGRSPEWNFPTFADPTANGIFPGMTDNKIVLYTLRPDTYEFVGAGGGTFVFKHSRRHDAYIIDIGFQESGVTANVVINVDKGYGSTEPDTYGWTISLTSARAGHHVRIVSRKEARFEDWYTFKIDHDDDRGLRRALQIIPWQAVDADGDGDTDDAIDVGSDPSSFQSYFSSVSVAHFWPDGADDTLTLFHMPNNGYQFDTISASAVPDSTADTTYVIGSASTLGWFVAGEPAVASDSYLLFPYIYWLMGDTGTTIDEDFIVMVLQGSFYNDTQFGLFSDFDLRPASGVTVNFAITDYPTGATGQDIDTDADIADANGFARTRLTLGDEPGAYKVTASLPTGGIWEFGEAGLFGTTRGVILQTGGYWKLLSLPVQPPSLTASNIMSNSTFEADEWKLYHYDPELDDIVEPSALEMGLGYWFKTLKDGFVFLDPASVTELTDTYYLPLAVGWNQVGLPFTQGLASADVLVQSSSGDTLYEIDTAAAMSLLVHRFYSWDGFQYVYGPDAVFGLDPYYLYPGEGHWIQALASCTLVFPAPSQPTDPGAGGAPAAISLAADYVRSGSPWRESAYRSPNFGRNQAPRLLTSPPLASKDRSHWTLQLIAAASGFSDMMNVVGVREAPPAQVLKAPNPPDGVSLSLSGTGNGRYASSFVEPSDEIVWSFDVKSGAAGEVVVRLSNLGSVPDEIPLTLKDETTRRKIDMRKNPVYKYSAYAGESRTFTLSADNAGATDGKIKLPTACAIQRVLGSGHSALPSLRGWRDRLMASPFGRKLAALYYGVAR